MAMALDPDAGIKRARSFSQGDRSYHHQPWKEYDPVNPFIDLFVKIDESLTEKEIERMRMIIQIKLGVYEEIQNYPLPKLLTYLFFGDYITKHDVSLLQYCLESIKRRDLVHHLDNYVRKGLRYSSQHLYHIPEDDASSRDGSTGFNRNWELRHSTSRNKHYSEIPTVGPLTYNMTEYTEDNLYHLGSGEEALPDQIEPELHPPELPATNFHAEKVEKGHPSNTSIDSTTVSTSVNMSDDLKYYSQVSLNMIESQTVNINTELQTTPGTKPKKRSIFKRIFHRKKKNEVELQSYRKH